MFDESKPAVKQASTDPKLCAPHSAVWSVTVDEHTKTDYLVTGAGSGRKVRQLRQSKELLQESLHEMRGQAAPENEGTSVFRNAPQVVESNPASDNITDITLNSVGKPTSGHYLTKCISNELQNSGACWTSTALDSRPLRLITARTPISESRLTSTQTYLETLSCGHQVMKFSDWYWDEGGHLINHPPTAKRRRCQECSEQMAIPFPKGRAA